MLHFTSERRTIQAPGYEHIEEKLKGVGAQIRRIGEMFPKKAAAVK